MNDPKDYTKMVQKYFSHNRGHSSLVHNAVGSTRKKGIGPILVRQYKYIVILDYVAIIDRVKFPFVITKYSSYFTRMHGLNTNFN